MIWKIVRTRAIDKEKVILDKDYIVEKFAKDINEEICKEGSRIVYICCILLLNQCFGETTLDKYI